MTTQLTSMFSLPTRQPDVPVSRGADALRRRIQKLPRKIPQVFLLSRLDQLPYVHLQSPLATASQRIEFRHWLDADALHLDAFQDTERLWRRLQAPAAVMGASGWQRRKRRACIGWLLLTAFLCSVLVTAEAFS